MKTYSQELLEKTLEKEAAPATPSWLSERRRKAFERFQKLGFPDRSHESWKYFDLKPILGSAFLAGEGNRLERLDQNEAGLVTLVSAQAFKDKNDLLKDHLAAFAAEEENPFALINTFSFKDVVLIHFPDHLTLDSPVHLLLVSPKGAQAQLSYPRILLVAGKCARAKVIVEFSNLGEEKHFSNAVSEVHLGEGACLDYFQIQRAGAAAIQLSTNRFYLKGFATLNAHFFAQGGTATRNESSVDFGGAGGFASLKGLALLKGESQIFNHPSVHHKAPHCTSRQFYKSILGGKANSEFNSLVSVPKNSQKSDSNQMSRTLLLSDQAQSFSRPQLRIDADDVQCVHGATVGQLQKDELFYLRSRGLSKKDARFLMTYGFAEEILEGMPQNVRPVLEDFTQQELKGMIG